MCDPHQEEQDELNDIRDGIGGDRFVQLNVEFEDIFSNEVLTEATSRFFSSEGLTIDEKDLKQNLASAKSAFNWIKQDYHARTNRTLSKPEFAKALAPAVKKCDEIMKSRPEQLLIQIRNNIENKLKMPKVA